MSEPTVKCGCGRTMTPDARRGRGAYRCGCRATITITTPKQSGHTCCAPDCGAGAILDYTVVPLCAEHAKLVALEMAPHTLNRYADREWFSLSERLIAFINDHLAPRKAEVS